MLTIFSNEFFIIKKKTIYKHKSTFKISTGSIILLLNYILAPVLINSIYLKPENKSGKL